MLVVLGSLFNFYLIYLLHQSIGFGKGNYYFLIMYCRYVDNNKRLCLANIQLAVWVNIAIWQHKIYEKLAQQKY